MISPFNDLSVLKSEVSKENSNVASTVFGDPLQQNKLFCSDFQIYHWIYSDLAFPAQAAQTSSMFRTAAEQTLYKLGCKRTATNCAPQRNPI